MALPPHLNPFVLPIEIRAAERHGMVDLYLPEADEPRPAVVFVHGLLMSEDRLTTRDWPHFQGYGSIAASRGVVGVTVDHRLYGPANYPLAAADVAAAVELARAYQRVDADRVAVWFFSGSGLLLADWLRTPPHWLRCVAASYPVLAAPPEWDVDPRFQPAAAVADAGTLPIVLTRVGRERPQFAATVEEFVTAAHACSAELEIIDVPEGQHGFDTLDHTDESRKAVERALNTVLAALR
jgi:acetyl esterase/lipase